jgi:hypothetical protein
MSCSVDKVVSIGFLFNTIVLAGLRVRSLPVEYRARKLTVGLRIPGVFLFISFHRRIVSFSETSSYILRMVGRPCYNTGS